MSLTRRELDAKLAQFENALEHLTFQLPAMLRDVRDIRARLQLPADPPADPTSPSTNGEALPEQPEGGQP